MRYFVKPGFIIINGPTMEVEKKLFILTPSSLEPLFMPQPNLTSAK